MASAARTRSDRERDHTMIVATGLYVLRYVSAKSEQSCPFVKVRLSSKDARGISLISAPGASNDGLSAPGDCVVVRAERPGELNLTISSTDPAASLEAELRLERVSSGIEERSDVPKHRRSENATAKPDLTIMAHVSRRGD